MLKTSFLLAALLIGDASIALAATKSLLNQRLAGILVAYQVTGDENNSVDVRTWSKAEFSAEYNNLIFPLASEKDVQKALLECVFLKEGAYGPHLGEKQVEKLAVAAALELVANHQGVELFTLEGVNINNSLISPNCAVVLISKDRVTAIEVNITD